MRYIIVVDEPDEYEKWYASQDPWLKMNSDYLTNVPEKLQEAAKIASKIENIEESQSVGEIVIGSSK